MKNSLLLLFLIFSISLYPKNKSQPITDFSQTKGFENALVSFCVIDETGKKLYSLNETKALTPASILKLVTSATALEILGESYQFKTSLLSDKDTLIIFGSGDPTLGSEYISSSPQAFLTEWTDAIMKNMKHVAAIRVDDSFFGYDGISRKWLREDIGNYYAAGSYGISIFDNTYKLFLDSRNTQPTVVKTEPDIPLLQFTNTLSVNQSGQDNGYILGEPFTYNRLLIGDIPANRSSFSIKGSIPDPGLFLGQTLVNHLKSKSLNVDTVYTARQTNRKAFTTKPKVFYTHTSPPLKEIIRVVNERSNNHYSEHLIRAIGKSKNNQSLEGSIEITKSFWQQQGLNTKSVFMYDGCGLAPSNAISSTFMCDLLHYMQTKSKNKDAFFASLPKAGKEGTVRNFLKGTRLEGKIIVKSGSIANVQCYAGYYIDNDKTYSFCIMVNNYTCTRLETIKAIEKLLLGIL